MYEPDKYNFYLTLLRKQSLLSQVLEHSLVNELLHKIFIILNIFVLYSLK